jgi:3',5'-cyclic-AMP phosphodiesterase
MNSLAHDEQRTADRVLAFVHIGDLHLTDAKQRNFHDFLAIAAQIEIECARVADFVVLPGDNADNGLAAQYALAATALKMLSVPVYAIPGDHDMEQGSLDPFYTGLRARALPMALTVRGNRCHFLDFCGPGGGGPDFRLGTGQMSWLRQELEEARACGETGLLFIHTYPADLKGDGETEALNRLIDSYDVALVDMGHTHYNELANNGRTIFAATRSTGQVEEGPVGYSIATLDSGIVSWRFKALDDPFPFVIITSPADYRLVRRSSQRVDRELEVRARIFGQVPIARAECRVEEGAWIPMARIGTGPDWRATIRSSPDALFDLTVRALAADGRPAAHSIRPAGRGFVLPKRDATGSDAASIGAWPENGISGA